MLFLLLFLLLPNLLFGMQVEESKTFQPKSLLLLALQAVSTQNANLNGLPEELRMAAHLLRINNGNAEKALIDAVDRRIRRLEALKEIERESALLEPDLVTNHHKNEMVSNLSFFGITPFLKGGVNPNVQDGLGCTPLELAEEHEDEGLKELIWNNNPNKVRLRLLRTW